MSILSKKEFLEKTQELKLNLFIDNKVFVVTGDSDEYKKFIEFCNFEYSIKQLMNTYSDLLTLFVIFSVNSVNFNCKLNATNNSYIEWQVVDSNNNELDSKFSYRIPGDDTIFDVCPTNPLDRWIVTQPKANGATHYIIEYIVDSNTQVVKIPILDIPQNLRGNVGVLAVQETEALIKLKTNGMSYMTTGDFLCDNCIVKKGSNAN